MRNLKLLTQTHFPLPSSNLQSHAATVEKCIGKLLVTSQKVFLTKLSIENNNAQIFLKQDLKDLTAWKSTFLSSPFVCSLDEEDEFCLFAYNSGRLFKPSAVDDSKLNLEFDHFSWSLDLGIGISLAEQELVLFDLDLQEISKVPLDQLPKLAPVNLGWGKESKKINRSLPNTEALLQHLPPLEPKEKWASHWSHDGNYFVISCPSPKSAIEQDLRVYNRNGELMSNGESKRIWLTQWRPMGNIACLTIDDYSPRVWTVQFFEINGLPHNSFALAGGGITPQTHYPVKMQFTMDGSVLLIHFVNREDDQDGVLQWWYSSNYHWFLKRQTCLNETLLDFSWDPEHCLLLHLFFDSRYEVMEFELDYIRDCRVQSYPHVMIDADKLLISPFKKAIVPPPMSLHTLSSKKTTPILEVAFSSNPNELVLLTCANALFFYNLYETTEITVASGELPLQPDIKNPRHLVWLSEERLLGLITYDPDLRKDILVLLRHEELMIVPKKNMVIPDQVIGTFVVNSELWLQTIRGELYQCKSLYRLLMLTVLLDSWKKDQLIKSDIKFGEACTKFMISYPNGSNEPYAVGLAPGRKLWLGSNLFSSECTSFFIHPKPWLLLFTTSQHELCLISSPVIVNGAMINKRPIERGAVIVSSFDLRVILQMPRGNLETISPRAIVLYYLAELLEAKEWRNALLVCRQNRIDLNVLVDLNQPRFMESIEEFLEQIPEVDYLNQFLTELLDENVLSTKYSQVFQSLNQEKKNTSEICELIRTRLGKIDANKYLPCMMVSFVRRSPPDLAAAVSLLASIKDDLEFSGALDCVVYLVEVENLYPEALRLYDLDLAVAILGKSQQDPLEYLQFINQLRAESLEKRKFRIDEYLGQYSKALESMSWADWKEKLDFIEKHGLFGKALQILTALNEDQRLELLCKYGEYLSKAQSYKNAAEIYLKAGNYPQAGENYIKSGDWKEVLSIGLISNSLNTLVPKLCEELESGKKWLELANVQMNLLKDPEAAIQSLTIGSHWKEALVLIASSDRNDLLETSLKPALLDANQRLLEDFAKLSQQYSNQSVRLVELLATPAFGVSGGAGEELSFDDVEVASSVANSQFTRYTPAPASSTARSSSYRGRKQERKRERGKKGTVYEKEYIETSLIKLIKNYIELYHDEVKCLIWTHNLLDQIHEAEKLSQSYRELGILLQGSRDLSLDQGLLSPLLERLEKLLE